MLPFNLRVFMYLGLISDFPPPKINEISMRTGNKISQEEVIDLKAKMISMALKDHDANFAKNAVNYGVPTSSLIPNVNISTKSDQ